MQYGEAKGIEVCRPTWSAGRVLSGGLDPGCEWVPGSADEFPGRKGQSVGVQLMLQRGVQQVY